MGELLGQDLLQVVAGAQAGRPVVEERPPPDEVAARFISVVGDGLLLQRAILGEVPHAREVVALATAALSGARTPGGGA